jgi:glutamate racemase
MGRNLDRCQTLETVIEVEAKSTPLAQASATGNTGLGYKRIGLFDSGVGGLTVLRSLSQAGRSMGKSIDFVYLGDTARCPYGNRSHGEIVSFVEEIVAWLASFQLDAVIMACNTSAASARDAACKTATKIAPNMAVCDLIEPTAQMLAGSATAIGVMATATTASSKAFSKALKRHGFSGPVKELGCPKLVPLIESGRLGRADCEAELSRALIEYLQILSEPISAAAGKGIGRSSVDARTIDTLILGCTHYPFLASRIESLVQGELAHLFPSGLKLVDPSRALAAQLFGTVQQVATPIRARLYSTGPAFEFAQTASQCLGEDIGPVTQLSLTELAETYLPASLEVISPTSFA